MPFARTGGSNPTSVVQVNKDVLEMVLALAPVNLKEVSFCMLCLETVPALVASRFRNLECLDLSHNTFARLPALLSKITTLQKVDMSFNENLQLDLSDIGRLAPLSDLKTLVLGKDVADAPLDVWSETSARVLKVLKTKLPNIEVAMLSRDPRYCVDEEGNAQPHCVWCALPFQWMRW